jgi:DNA-binding GntR family transcriptional regulator
VSANPDLSLTLPIIPVTRVDQVRGAVLRRIFAGLLQPGQRIVEAKLASELGVSQATVNAALQDMHNQGIVNKMANRFTKVSQYTSQEIENLFSVRLILEPAAVAVVAAAVTDGALKQLHNHLEEMRAAARHTDVPAFCLADYRFHQAIYALSGNPFLIQACQAIAAAPFAYILCGGAKGLPVDYPALAEDHQLIITELQKGPDAAARITRERIEAWRLHSVHALNAAVGAASI